MTQVALKLVQPAAPSAILDYAREPLNQPTQPASRAACWTKETVRASESTCLFLIFTNRIWFCLHNFGFWSLNKLFKQQKTLRAVDLFPLFPILLRSARREPAPRLGSRTTRSLLCHSRWGTASGCSSEQQLKLIRAGKALHKQWAGTAVALPKQLVHSSRCSLLQRVGEFLPTCKLCFQDEIPRIQRPFINWYY